MKKKWLGYIGLSILFVLLFSITIYKVDTVSTEARIKESGVHPTIIIDPGHGDFDGGASANNVIEKDVNLAISLKLRDLLKVQGFEVIMTRKDDKALDNMPNAAIRVRKVEDMHKRMAIMQENPDAIFVSIHQNKYEDSRIFGAQVFYSPNGLESENLANILQKNFVNLQPDNKRLPKKAENNLYLLYNSPIPAVIVECGFLSNPTEAANLCDEDYQKKIAMVILTSLLQYLQAEQENVMSSTEMLS